MNLKNSSLDNVLNENTNMVFKAIADNTRREIIRMLVSSIDGLSITQIANQFSMSRQAVTKHLKVLEDADLLVMISRGTEKFSYINLTPLREVHSWISTYESFWDQGLHLLEKYLNLKG